MSDFTVINPSQSINSNGRVTVGGTIAPQSYDFNDGPTVPFVSGIVVGADASIGSSGGGAGVTLDELEKLPFYMGGRTLPKNSKLVDAVVPELTANERTVVEIELGELLNSKCVTISFWNSSATIDDILGAFDYSNNLNPSNLLPLAGGYDAFDDLRANVPYISGIPSSKVAKECLVVTENYEEAIRIGGLLGENEKVQERFVSGGESTSNTQLSLYSNLFYTEVGVLVGWYSSSAGFIGLDQITHLESAWLATAAGITTLYLAIYNEHAENQTTELNFKVAVYE